MNTAGNIFVSSSAFQTQNLSEILDACFGHGISGLELSHLNTIPSEHLVNGLEAYTRDNRIRLLVHNYFPSPNEPFVLNLASNRHGILESSRSHCKKAVDLCARLNIPFYSVHAGFCFHAEPSDLGRDQTSLPRFPMEEAEGIFIESLKMVSQYAGSAGVDIAVENNVLAPFNLVHGKNELFLGLSAGDLTHIIDRTGAENLFVLLDLAHLKVTAASLDLDPVGQVKALSHRIKAVHMSDNDGKVDSHGKISASSWFWPVLVEHLPAPAPIILEAHDLSVQEISGQVNLIKEKMNSRGSAP